MTDPRQKMDEELPHIGEEAAEVQPDDEPENAVNLVGNSVRKRLHKSHRR